MSITPEILEARKSWIAALRSGTYNQGRRNLFNPEKKTYCCLGVLMTHLGSPELLNDHIKGYGNITSFVEESIRKKVDLSDRVAGVLAGFNDVGGSFGEIADILEKYITSWDEPTMYYAIQNLRMEKAGQA